MLNKAGVKAVAKFWLTSILLLVLTAMISYLSVHYNQYWMFLGIPIWLGAVSWLVYDMAVFESKFKKD